MIHSAYNQIFVVFLLMFVQASSISKLENRVTYEGKYENIDYRFAVQIPPGLVGRGAVPHAPNHGFFIVFTDSLDCISVTANYDTIEPPNPLTIKSVQEKSDAMQILAHREKQITLGGIRVLQKMKKVKKNNTIYVIVNASLTLTVKKERIIYSLHMHVPEKYFKQRESIYNSLLASFQFIHMEEITDLEGRKIDTED